MSARCHKRTSCLARHLADERWLHRVDLLDGLRRTPQEYRERYLVGRYVDHPILDPLRKNFGVILLVVDIAAAIVEYARQQIAVTQGAERYVRAGRRASPCRRQGATEAD